MAEAGLVGTGGGTVLRDRTAGRRNVAIRRLVPDKVRGSVQNRRNPVRMGRGQAVLRALSASGIRYLNAARARVPGGRQSRLNGSVSPPPLAQALLQAEAGRRAKARVGEEGEKSESWIPESSRAPASLVR